MKLSWALLFGAATLGVHAGVVAPAERAVTVVRRQEGGNPTTSAPAEQTSSARGGSSSQGGTPSTSNGGGGSGSSSSSQGGGDTTVFVTSTVTNNNVDTVTRSTTVQTTSTFVVVVISTIFETATVTQQGATATKTIWTTSTVIDNNKRAFVDLGPRTLPVAAEAYPTEAAGPSVDHDSLEMVRKREHGLHKRATVTEVRTVTIGSNGASTLVNTITQTVVVTSSQISTTTMAVTETEVQNASVTVSVTSTLTVTSTAVTTGAQTTQTSTQTGTPNGGNSSNDSGGLSTGAKAGIGAGVGVGALLILGALAFFFIRRRRGPKADPDAMAGASEVPVGGPVGGTPPMSHQSSAHHAAAAGLLGPGGRAPPTKPSPEGYRGTAMGDGRAGYAKPAYGAAYAQAGSTSPTNRSSTLNSSSPFSPTGQTVSSMGADSLPAHPAPNDNGAAELGTDHNAAASRWTNAGAVEMDSTGLGHQSTAPPENVYEMPAQPYK